MKQENKKTLEILLITTFFILIFLFGIFLNKVVIVNNNGRMPVYEYRFVGETERHFSFLDKNEIKLWYLSDIFFAEKDIWFGNMDKGDIFSIGDYFIIIGFYGFFLSFLSLISLGIIIIIKSILKDLK